MTAATNEQPVQTICAVVVTFNRKDLLRECIEALLAQTRPLQRIIIVDNASTDGTRATVDSLRTAYRRIDYKKLATNVGGAGGFSEGFRAAYHAGYEWIWAMDDDTIVAPDALQQLFEARAKFFTGVPDLLCSQVVWRDGTIHPMNKPWPKIDNCIQAKAAQRFGLQSIRATTFVATLLHRRLVAEFGLPIADYFIWSDDIEYTGRILRHNLGVLVPESRALHKTERIYTSLDSAPERFYFHVRNSLWMLTRSAAWTMPERWSQAKSLFMITGAYLKRGKFAPARVTAIVKGIRDGLLRTPKRQYV